MPCIVRLCNRQLESFITWFDVPCYAMLYTLCIGLLFFLATSISAPVYYIWSHFIVNILFCLFLSWLYAYVYICVVVVFLYFFFIFNFSSSETASPVSFYGNTTFQLLFERKHSKSVSYFVFSNVFLSISCALCSIFFFFNCFIFSKNRNFCL